MKDETYSKKTLTHEEFGEMLDIGLSDLYSAIRHRDLEAAKKVAESLSRLRLEQYPKLQQSSEANKMEAPK